MLGVHTHSENTGVQQSNYLLSTQPGGKFVTIADCYSSDSGSNLGTSDLAADLLFKNCCTVV